MGIQRVSRDRVIGAVGGLGVGLVGWSIIVPRPTAYIIGLLFCLPLVGRTAVVLIRRRVPQLQVIWPVGVMVAIATIVAGIGLPKAALFLETNSDVRWTTYPFTGDVLDDRAISSAVTADRVYLRVYGLPLASYDRRTGHLIDTDSSPVPLTTCTKSDLTCEWTGPDRPAGSGWQQGNDDGITVLIHGKRLTAIDTVSKAVLWTRVAPGKIVRVSAGNGGLLVASRPNSHNPLLSHTEQNRTAIVVTTWVARTGKQTGKLLLRDGNSFRGLATGPGQAVLVHYETAQIQLMGAS